MKHRLSVDALYQVWRKSTFEIEADTPEEALAILQAQLAEHGDPYTVELSADGFEEERLESLGGGWDMCEMTLVQATDQPTLYIYREVPEHGCFVSTVMFPKPTQK